MSSTGPMVSYEERLRGCNARNMNRKEAEGLSPEATALLKQVKGVGTTVASTCVLTLEVHTVFGTAGMRAALPKRLRA